VMLVLTQLAVGGFVVELLARLLGPRMNPGVPGLRLASLSFGFVGLAASLFHLGRPMFAYRALLGIRHSWLSREVAAFGAFAAFATAHIVLQNAFSSDLLAWPLLCMTVVSGLIGVGMSVMVYHAVRRPFWAASIGGIKFAGTTVLLGLSTALACHGLASAVGPTKPASVAAIPTCLIVATAAKLGFEFRMRRRALSSQDSPLRKSELLMAGPLKPFAARRIFHGITGGIALPAIALVGAFGPHQWISVAAAVLSLPVLLAAESTERLLFFTAVVKPKMPGSH
jgi:formate dehydrogenase iron-sulfur subunit